MDKPFICPNCGEDKTHDVGVRLRDSGRYSYYSYCRPCQLSRQRRHHRENPGYRRELNKRYRGKVRQRIWDIKVGGECVRCGYGEHPAALDFHHRDPSQKEFSIADINRAGLSAENIQAEIDKCDLICANCHRIEHATETGTVGK